MYQNQIKVTKNMTKDQLDSDKRFSDSATLCQHALRVCICTVDFDKIN